MNTQETQQNALEDIQVSVKLKLATLWTSLMFLIIYLDYFALYMPSIIEDILRGRVFVFDITQGFLLGALAFSDNSGTDDFPFCCWVIETKDKEFKPGTLMKWLEGRLPQPVDDLDQWTTDD